MHALVFGLLVAPTLLAFALEWRVLPEFVGAGWTVLLKLIGWVVFLPLSYAYLCVILVLIGWRLAIRLIGVETWAPRHKRVAHGVLALLLLTSSVLVGLTPWLPDPPPRRSTTLMQTLGCIAAMHGCGRGAPDPYAKQRRAWRALGFTCGLFALSFTVGGATARPRANPNEGE